MTSVAIDPSLLQWMLDSDPALRWQVERDPAGGVPEVWEATRARIATLREWGLDPATVTGTAPLLEQHSRWEYDDLPFWGGEVDCCINAATLSSGACCAPWVRGMSSATGRLGSPTRSAPGAPCCALWITFARHPFSTAANPTRESPPRVDIIRGRRQADGTWLQQLRLPGRVWFDIDLPPGEPSK